MSYERREYRLALSHVDRALDLRPTVVLSRHPSETLEHVTLRVLAYCLLYQDGVTFGPGVIAGDEPDLEAHDLTGKVSLWIACGDVSVDLVRKAVQHHREAAIHLLFGRASRRDAFLEAVAHLGKPPRGWDRVTLWTVDEKLVTALSMRESPRQSWAVTIVGDHFYVEAGGETVDGAVERRGG